MGLQTHTHKHILLFFPNQSTNHLNFTPPIIIIDWLIENVLKSSSSKNIMFLKTNSLITLQKKQTNWFYRIHNLSDLEYHIYISIDIIQPYILSQFRFDLFIKVNHFHHSYSLISYFFSHLSLSFTIFTCWFDSTLLLFFFCFISIIIIFFSSLKVNIYIYIYYYYVWNEIISWWIYIPYI